MDGKKVAGGVVSSRRGTGTCVSQRDKHVNSVENNAQFCNRIGCNGRLNYNYTKGTRIGCSDKAKHPTPSSNGKEIVGNSSEVTSDTSLSRGKSLYRVSNEVKKDLPVIINPSPSRLMKETKSGKIISRDIGESSNSKNPKMLPQKSRVDSTKNNGSGSSKYGLRNLKCNSISDVIPRPSESSFRKRVSIKSKTSEGETSREKKLIKQSNEHVNERSTRGISISENGGSLARNRRLLNVNSRLRLASRGVGNNSPQVETPVNETSLYQNSPEASSSGSSSYSLSHSDGNDLIPSSTLFTSTELGISRFMNSDASRRYNMDGIAEVLMELERIERNEEISYEQLLALETNLLLNSLNIYDQHRDLRLDIDNMSYEELLALEEKMGNVSTALSEEAISKCLTKSIYSESGKQNDMKCSICQEEYEVGDEIGKSECSHRFHLQCIEQWLRLKNWCPICKSSA